MHPLTLLSSFKDLRQKCLKRAKTRLTELTKWKAITDAGAELGRVQDKSACFKETNFVDCSHRSSTYVSTLTKPHSDIDRFTRVLDSLLDCAANSLYEMDDILTKVIEDKSRAQDAEKKMSEMASEWKALNFDSGTFAHHQEAWDTYNKYMKNMQQWHP